MIKQHILKQLKKRKKLGLYLPDYGKYCISNIPKMVMSLFDLEKEKNDPLNNEWGNILKKPKKVILFLIDGFGFNKWIKHQKNIPLLDLVTKKGTVLPLMSVFPSTTAAAITTMHSGVTPMEHGLPEWEVYFEEIDKIIITLQFSPINGGYPDKMIELGVNPKILFNGETIYQKLKRKKINSYVLLNEADSKSVYSDLVHKGAKEVPYKNATDLALNLKDLICKNKTKSYYYAYWDMLDSISHKYGPDSIQYKTELENILHVINKNFIQKLDKKTAKETVIIFAADHGQVKVSPKKIIALDKYPKISKFLDRSKNGKKILPWGSPRDLIIKIKPGKIEKAYKYLKTLLKNKATVLKTEEAIMEGFFGQGKPHKKFKKRMGDIIILPEKDYMIWYDHIKGKKSEVLTSLGFHGGLSKNEIFVPFAFCSLEDIIK